MKRYFLLDCEEVKDSFYEPDENASIFTQLMIGIHLLYCPDCAMELKKLQRAEEMMKTEFFPNAPDFSEAVMERIEKEADLDSITDVPAAEVLMPAGFSFRGWVITGFFLFLSLITVFFGANFIEIAELEGQSFLLPIGLTIGMVLSGYGALFIGSHLKELTLWFRQR